MKAVTIRHSPDLAATSKTAIKYVPKYVDIARNDRLELFYFDGGL
jgi:hypothetical protein